MVKRKTTGKGKSRIQREWFMERMRSTGLSMRSLSKKMQRDESTVSLILSGNRGVTPAEAKLMADLLLVPVTELLRNLGVDVQDDVRKVPIAGHINGDAEVLMHARGTEEYVVGPADLPTDAIAAQFRTVGSAMYWRDGWLAFFSATHLPPEDCIGRVSILAERASGKIYFAGLERGYKAGLYNLVFGCGGINKMLENTAVAWASPVLWIRPRQ